MFLRCVQRRPQLDFKPLLPDGIARMSPLLERQENSGAVPFAAKSVHGDEGTILKGGAVSADV